MEKRMYGLVNYQLTGIQKGIQFLHGVVEYSQMVNKIGGYPLDIYNDWANNYKTVILLNGGTTNYRPSIEDGLPFGTLNKHLLELDKNNINFAYFNEPDLGDQLTTIVFIVDERVFNKEKWPDFDPKSYYGDTKFAWQAKREMDLNPTNPQFPDCANVIGSDVKVEFQKWIHSIGGYQNLFLRNFLKNFRLA